MNKKIVPVLSDTIRVITVLFVLFIGLAFLFELADSFDHFL